MEVDERVIFYSIISFMIVEYLWEFYLEIRQHRVYKKNTHIPHELIGILSTETFEKARLYAIDKSNYRMVKDTISLIIDVGLLLCNILFIFWSLAGSCLNYFGYESNEKNEILQSAFYIIINSIISTITKLPFSVYSTFVLEEKHGFNKQTVPFFIKDNIKAFIVTQIISVPLTCAVIYIVKIGGDYFFIYLWFFAMAMTFFLYTIYPDYIAPLFDKYTVLPEGELRTEIESLARSVQFPLYKLYVVEGSKRSAHSNAYFYGFYKSKRIVLFDTLLKDYKCADSKGETEVEEKKSETQEKKGCDTYEVLAVLGHELGHWKLNHIVKNLVIAQVNLLFVFVVFKTLFQFTPMYRAFGFENSTPIIVGLIIVLQYVFAPYFEVLNYLMAILSRHFEFEADRFAKKLGRANYLKRALIKLNCDNLGFPIYDPWYSKWHHSHPPLLERIQALEKAD